jgi:hypothetical protein
MFTGRNELGFLDNLSRVTRRAGTIGESLRFRHAHCQMVRLLGKIGTDLQQTVLSRRTENFEQNHDVYCFRNVIRKGAEILVARALGGESAKGNREFSCQNAEQAPLTT